MNHPTRQELFEYADGLPGRARSMEMEAHLRECPRCRAFCDAALGTGNALRRLPREQPSAEFNRKLLSRLGLREAASVWWLFFRNFAPVLAAGIVAAVIMTLGSSGQGAAGESVGKSLFDTSQLAGALRDALDGASAWTETLFTRYVSLSIGKDSLSQVIFLACLFAGIGLLDRYILGPILRRRQQG